MSSLPNGLQPSPNTNHGTRYSCNKPTVVGIYGIPGSGKSSLLDGLKEHLREGFVYYEGSEVIDSVVPGGLAAFQNLGEREKMGWRRIAIDTVEQHCNCSGQVAVVAGHFMFWLEEEEAGQAVCTDQDLKTYTHIIYLDVPAEVVANRRQNDTNRNRPAASETHLEKWQQAEISQLRHLCRHHGILFALVPSSLAMFHRVMSFLCDFQQHSEEHNMSCAQSRLDEIVARSGHQLQTMLVIDGDRTLAADDTGALFWETVSGSRTLPDGKDPLKALFGGPLGYSYTAFRQAALLYEEAADVGEFVVLCEKLASTVTIRAEFLSLLQRLAEHRHVGAVVVTCGLRRIWENVLEKAGLSEMIGVIGGGRVADGFVVTAAVKAALVSRLRNSKGIYVWAFGDSPLDVDMLRKADQAIVVVGEEGKRSKSMDAALLDAICNHGLVARQAIIPINSAPRLDTVKLPVVNLADHDFLDSVFRHNDGRNGVQVFHATNRNAAKLLMTSMRDARIAGARLREAHREVGRYLATEFLTDVIGVEEHPIPHVQGNETSGYRLLHEQKTLIVALMRGGEPMAFGVNEAFPLAAFIHAKHAGDVMLHHLQGQETVILVDSVVNNGKTVVEFVQHIRELHAAIRIVVVAGVVQAQAVAAGGRIQALACSAHLTLVALRLSDNKFTGRGGTDTGNRLFNTTHLC